MSYSPPCPLAKKEEKRTNRIGTPRADHDHIVDCRAGVLHITDRCADCKAPSPRWASISLGKSSDLIHFRFIRRLGLSSCLSRSVRNLPSHPIILVLLRPHNVFRIQPNSTSIPPPPRPFEIEYDTIPLPTGVFLCVQCASVHRKLGTHNSRV